jgi:hypothetical protein
MTPSHNAIIATYQIITSSRHHARRHATPSRSTITHHAHRLCSDPVCSDFTMFMVPRYRMRLERGI